MTTYFVISNWWSQTHTTIPVGISCSTELKTLQLDLGFTKKEQVESIVMADPAIKKLVDNGIYCEFMSLSTLYTENGTYQILNINLNNTKELTAEVNLKNNLVVSYELNNLTRTGGPAVYVEPVDITLPYTFFGALTVGIIVYFFKIKKRK